MIKKQTIEYKLVSIIGLAGEIQTEEIYKLKYGKEYIRKTISKLITKKCIKVYKFDKLTLSGKSVPVHFADYVNVDSEFATLKYNFKVLQNETKGEYQVSYEFCIRKVLDESAQNTEYEDKINQKYKAVIFDEVLSYSYKDADTKVKMMPNLDTRTEEVFLPKSKYSVLVGNNKKTEMNLLSDKKLAYSTSRSFIFSRELLTVLRQHCKEQYHLELFESLIWYGNYELFVIDTANSGMITMNALPLAFKYEENGKASIGSLMIKLNDATLIPQDALEIVKNVVKNMNVVLTQIVPGLTIGVKDLGILMIRQDFLLGCFALQT